MKRRFALAAALVAILWAAWPVPPLPEVPLAPRVLDRHGATLAEWPGPGEVATLPARVETALLAAEDHRFRYHPGIDPIGIVRAARENLQEGKIVQGGSTITQQLVRTVRPRPAGLKGKLWEASEALRLELRLSKDEVLSAWANRVYFGHGAWGIDAAAQVYFDKETAHLSLAEAALLAALPRRPSALDPWIAPEAAMAARERVLDRIEALGTADSDELEIARAEPLTLRREAPYGHAPHFVRTLSLDAGDNPTSLDLDLQLEVEGIVRSTLDELDGRNVDHAAVLVVERRTGDPLAWVGSADWEADDGQVDGVLAARSPGSALKPFVYWLALEMQTITMASIVMDTPGSWGTTHGTWAPANYDASFYGPIRAREALACSRNLPAVRVLEQVGVANLHRRLEELGVTTLTERPDHYGLALSLGDGEVRLDELVEAYRRMAEGVVGDPAAAALVLDVLDDPDARARAFGVDSVLEPDFPLAAKTGTSAGWRDNWAVGVTPVHVIGVWVGNFDGSPMVDVSGITGAGPILRQVAEIVSEPGPMDFGHPSLVAGPICPETGLRRGDACPLGMKEQFLAGTAPTETCSHDERSAPLLISPEDGTTWYLDPARSPEQQAIPLRALAAREAEVSWLVDGVEVAQGEAARWVPTSGAHRVTLRVDGVEVGRSAIHVGP